MKKFTVPLALIILLAVIATVFFLKGGSKAVTLPQEVGKRQVINALPFAERPFVALVPHTSNKLLTLYFDKPGKGQNIKEDIEYLSGTSLKGGRTAITDLTNMPYTTAFLLGSCSTGGKCSFDTDITTGTIKTSMEIGDELDVLKSNFVYIGADESVTSDQKLAFKSTTKLAFPAIVSQTHGFIGNVAGDVAAEPVAITSSSDKKLAGKLTIYAPSASKLLIYDGTAYQPLTATKTIDRFVASINQMPWSKTVSITRDDQKGSSEQVTLYLVGPIVPVK